MAELFDMKELEERVILIAVSTDDEDTPVPPWTSWKSW